MYMKFKNDVVAIVFSIFLCIGVFFTIVGIIVGAAMNSAKAKMVPCEAQIKEIQLIRVHDSNKHDSKKHDVYVDYEFDGQLYEDRFLGYYTSSMYKGQTIEILVNPTNPNKIMGTGATWLFTAIFGGIGVVFLLTGGIALMIRGRKRAKVKRLLREGKRIYGVIESIELNPYMEINRRHPSFAVVIVKDDYTLEEKRYKSESFWEDIASTIKVGDSAVVYVDQANENNYFVDVTGANSVMGSAISNIY